MDKLEQIYECSEYLFLFFFLFFNPLSWLNVRRIRNVSLFHRLFEIDIKVTLSVNITQIQNSNCRQGKSMNQCSVFKFSWYGTKFGSSYENSAFLIMSSQLT